MKLFRLFVLFGFGVIAAYSQGTPYDCFSVFSFTAASSQTGQNNASSQSPCVAWRVTYTTTGFSSVTVKFQTSPDSSSWSDVTNSICSSSVQPPCVTDGANPLDAGVQGSASFRAYGKYVRVSVTSVTGSGSGQVVVYGYKGTSASAGLGSGGGSSGIAIASVQETIAYTSLIAAATSQSISVGSALPERSKVIGVNFNVTTPFTSGSVTGMSGSVGRTSFETELMLPQVIIGSGAITQTDSGGFFSSTLSSFQVLAQFVATAGGNLGSGSVTNLTAGSAQVTVLYVVMP